MSADPQIRRHLRKLDELRHLDVLVDDFVEALIWARDSAQSFEEENAALRGEVDDLRGEMDDLKKENDELTQAINKLEKEIEDLENERDEANSLTRTLQDELDRLKASA